MRSSLIAVAAIAAVGGPSIASASPGADDEDVGLPPRGRSIGVEMLFADIASGSAGGIGPVVEWLRNRGRLGGFVDAGAGVLLSDTRASTHVGLYASGRLGGRVLAAAYAPDPTARLWMTLETGVGVDQMWLPDADAWMRPDAFVGWTSMLGTSKRSFAMSIRIEASPTMTNASVLRAVCGGPCTTPVDAPVDFTLMISGGVVSW